MAHLRARRRRRAHRTFVSVVVAVTASVAGLATRSAGAVDAGDGEAAIVTAAVGADVVAIGGAPALASTRAEGSGAPVVGMARAATGVWLARSDGTVSALGSTWVGDLGGARLNRPVVGLSATASGAGFWLVASDGGIFTFGDASFLGSTGGVRLNRPVVAMAATPTGRGYWLVASDGGVFTFGDAGFFGSLGSIVLNRPIVGMAATPTGLGYWLLAADGGVFSFGDAPFLGRPPVTGDIRSAGPVTGAWGYALLGTDGTAYRYDLASGLTTLTVDPATRAGRPAVAIAAAPGAGAWVALSDQLDTATISGSRGLDAGIAWLGVYAAAAMGASAAIVHQGTVSLASVWRGSAPIQSAPPGYLIPMSTIATDPSAAASVWSSEVAAAVGRGEVAMGATSAGLRGASAGDRVRLVGWNGAVVDLTIGVIADDAEVDGAELAMSTATADALGFSRPSYEVIFGFASRDVATATLERVIPKVGGVRVRHSWDPADPDSTLSLARLKALLGEAAVARTGATTLALDPAWRGANIVSANVPIIGTITCHRSVVPAIAGALGEVAAAGLAGAIDVADTRRAGGCFNPREITTTSGTSGRNISRHSFGAAIDINPSSNPFGGRPRMDPRVVAIFHRWGFAWGGTWAIPDGMHFEFVGEPRG